MKSRIREQLAEHEALRLIQEQGINCLPVDPICIAQSLGILVEAKHTTDGVSGMLVRLGNQFAIGYSTYIDNQGFQRFSIAHELGHYRISGHIDGVFEHKDVHYSQAGFSTENPYEREADVFAANLLMPKNLCLKELKKFCDGLQAVESLASLCGTSLTAAAVRYVQLADVPVAMVVSTNQSIDYCLMSRHLKEFNNLVYPRKNQPLPFGSETSRFNKNSDNIRSARTNQYTTNLRDWFEGSRNIPGSEEIVGLGRYGKTLTILLSEIYSDEDDEDEDLERSWNVNFR